MRSCRAFRRACNVAPLFTWSTIMNIKLEDRKEKYRDELSINKHNTLVIKQIKKEKGFQDISKM